MPVLRLGRAVVPRSIVVTSAARDLRAVEFPGLVGLSAPSRPRAVTVLGGVALISAMGNSRRRAALVIVCIGALLAGVAWAVIEPKDPVLVGIGCATDEAQSGVIAMQPDGRTVVSICRELWRSGGVVASTRTVPALTPCVANEQSPGAIIVFPTADPGVCKRNGKMLADRDARGVPGGTASKPKSPWQPVLGNKNMGHPTVGTSAVPADQLRMLGVLRRPQVDTDRGPDVEDILRHALTNNRESGGVSGVRTDAIRRIAKRSDAAWIIVPAERAKYPVTPKGSGSRDVLCVLSKASPSAASNGYAGGYGGACRISRDIALGRLSGGAASGRRLQLWGVVPDGVDTVKARLRGDKGIIVKVRDNTYVIDAVIPDRAWLGHYIWYDRNGNELRRR